MNASKPSTITSILVMDDDRYQADGTVIFRDREAAINSYLKDFSSALDFFEGGRRAAAEKFADACKVAQIVSVIPWGDEGVAVFYSGTFEDTIGRETEWTDAQRAAAADVVSRAREFVVIDDGSTCYPVLRKDLGDMTEAKLTAMTAEEYAAWSNRTPYESRVGKAGGADLIYLCDLVHNAGAPVWNIA